MSRSWTTYLAGAAFALTTAGAAAAYAQAAPGDSPRVERHERTVIVRQDGDGERQERRVIVRHGGMDHAEHLRTMLQLKPSQEPALTAYLAAIKPEHDHERVVEMSDHGEAKTTPQRLADMEAMMARHTAAMHTRIEATRRFYDQLEPSQKKVFDELPMLMGPMAPMGPMKVMVNMEGMPHVAFPPDRFEPPVPPGPPAAPRAPHAPAPPRD